MYSEIYNNEENIVTRIYTACNDRPNNSEHAWVVPSKCPKVPDFDRYEMCRVMRGRLLLFIGDSLTVNTVETFLNAMGNRTVFTPSPILQSFSWCETPFTTLIIMAPNIRDHVHLYYSMIQEHSSYCCLVVVASWGIHFVEDEVFSGALQQHLSFFLSLNATFIFRGGSMAHLDCSLYTGPDNSYNLTPADHPDHPEWHWAAAPGQSTRVARPLLKAENKQYFLDLMVMNQRRPDRHPGGVDCLHYCIPGPIDQWIRLVFATLHLIHIGGFS